MQLTNPVTVRQLLKEFHTKPRKKLGQNFLVNEKVLQKLIDAAELNRNDLVIEPGAGIGTTTVELAKHAGKVLAYELDSHLIPILQHNLKNLLDPKGLERVGIQRGDILNAFHKGNLSETLDPKGLGGYKLIGSVPYQITSPLIHETIYQHQNFNLAVMIIQEEVAEKITALPPKASYLSNFVQRFAKVELINGQIAPSSFWPRPGVESALVRLGMKDQALGNSRRIEPQQWSRFLHSGFSQPRKVLRRVFEEELLKEAQIVPTARAQELSLNNWEKLFLLQTEK